MIFGYLSRWHGGWGPQVSKGIKNTAWAVSMAIAIGIFCPLWTLVFAPLCLLKGAGHGRIYQPGLPLDLTKDPETVEKYIIGGLHGKISDKWYKVLGMALVGLGAVSGAVLAFSFVSLPAAFAIALGGLFKGINALAFSNETQTREFADGAAVDCGLLLAIMVLL